MKHKRMISLFTAIAMIFSLLVILPISENWVIDVKAATDVSNLSPVNSTYEFLKMVEGYSPNCFWDYKQWSIGYGNKCPYSHSSNGTKYKQNGGHTITEEAARALLNEKLPSYVNTLKSNCKGLSMNQNQFDALLSATYNHGNVDASSNSRETTTSSSNSSNVTSTDYPSSPKTGDSFKMILYAVQAAAAFVTMTFMYRKAKDARDKTE